MKNNILSKLSFVFVAIFSFIAFNGLVKAKTITVANASDFTNAYNSAEYGSDQNLIWDIQSDITVSINPHFTRSLSLVINGNGHKITFTKNGGDAIGYAFSFNHMVDVTINDLTIIVGDGYRSGVFVTDVPATLNNVNITMAQENQPVISNKLKFGCQLVVNYAHVTLKGNNAFEANQWSWSAVDLISKSADNAVLEIQNDATLNITDNRTNDKKRNEPVVKLSSVDGDGHDIEPDFERVYLVNPERTHLAQEGDGQYYFYLDEIRVTVNEIKVGNEIPTSLSVIGLP